VLSSRRYQVSAPCLPAEQADVRAPIHTALLASGEKLRLHVGIECRLIQRSQPLPSPFPIVPFLTSLADPTGSTYRWSVYLKLPRTERNITRSIPDEPVIRLEQQPQSLSSGLNVLCVCEPRQSKGAHISADAHGTRHGRTKTMATILRPTEGATVGSSTPG